MSETPGIYQQDNGKPFPDRYKILRVKFSFETWMKNGESIYGTPEDLENELSTGAFHSGTVFEGTIKVPQEEVPKLKNAIESRAIPVVAILEVKIEE